MDIGMLTTPLSGHTLDDINDMIEDSFIDALEIPAHPGSPHIDAAKLTKSRIKEIRAMLDDCMLTISSLCYYTCDISNPKKIAQTQTAAKKVIDAAAALNVPVVCMLTGFAAPGMTKLETIQKVLPKAFKPILAHAAKKGINIAVENWYQTCLQGLDTFEALFEAIPNDNFGLNYDPSHLVHQGCDHLAPVALYKDRLFHTHAKDTLIDYAQRARQGVYAEGWWRYVIPGYGCINWGEYIGTLMHNGYDGVLSIEHEDTAFDALAGFFFGANHLAQFC
jgi:sugar phosphate isomerase/epimerase